MPGVESRQQPGAGAALVPLLDHVAAVTPGKHVASVASRSHVTREHLAEDAPVAVGLLLLVLLVLVVLLAGRHVARVQHRGGGARHVAVVPAVLATRALTLHHVIIVTSVKLEYLESQMDVLGFS